MLHAIFKMSYLIFDTEMFIQKLASVNALEGSKTTLYCETEEQDAPVEWFKNGFLMTECTTDITMEAKNGRFYKLIFARANLQDRGTYSIRKNGIINKAVLNVTGNLIPCILRFGNYFPFI